MLYYFYNISFADLVLSKHDKEVTCIMYELFMDDYMREALEEQARYFNQPLVEKSKEGVFKENFYFRDNLQKPKITPAMEKEQNRQLVFELVGKFMDEHQTQLSTSGPVYTWVFGEEQVMPIYNMLELTPDDILQLYTNMVAETYNGNISQFITGWVRHAPHKIMLTALLIDALQHGYDDIVECCEFMWAACEYPVYYRKFWKTGVKEETMNHTIEHLGSKFQIKKVSNLKALLSYDAHTSVEYMTDRLKLGDDSVYIDFMYRMQNQIKNKLKNISREYYKTNEAGATQHSKSSTFDDGSQADQEGHTTNVAQVVTTTVNKFATGGINNGIVKVAADYSNVDKDTLAGYINQITNTKNNRLSRLVEDIITAFFFRNPTTTSVGSAEFMNYGLALYRSIGTSKDPLYAEIKDILNFWMNDIIQIQNYYKGPGTIINYTRAIYNYIVIMIVHYN